jgi:hypothetical protein
MTTMLPINNRMIHLDILKGIEYVKRTPEEVSAIVAKGKVAYPEALVLHWVGGDSDDLEWKKEGAYLWEFFQEHSLGFNSFTPGQRMNVIRREDGTVQISHFG